MRFPAPILNLRQARVARNSPRAKGEIQEGRGDFPPNMRIAQNRDFSKSKGSRIGRASRKYRPSLRANDVISVPQCCPPSISESVICTVFFESQLANFRDLEPFPPQAAQLVAFSRLLCVARCFGCGCARRGALASALFGFRLAKVRDLRGFRPVFLHRRWDFCQLLAPARPRGRNGSRQRTQGHFPTFRCFRKVNQPNPFGCAHARMGFATTFNWIQCSTFGGLLVLKKSTPNFR